jgi:hypothetical protein
MRPGLGLALLAGFALGLIAAAGLQWLRSQADPPCIDPLPPVVRAGSPHGGEVPCGIRVRRVRYER